MGLREVIARYDEIIRGLDEAPVIMGHSFGGAITQVLLDRGPGARRCRHRLGPRQGGPSAAVLHPEIRLAGTR